MRMRGPTYTPEWLHACEVRYVLAKQTTGARRAYLELCRARRSPEAVSRLMDDVASAFRARQSAASGPISPAEEASRDEQVSVHCTVNDEQGRAPEDGSFLEGAARGYADARFSCSQSPSATVNLSGSAGDQLSLRGGA